MDRKNRHTKIIWSCPAKSLNNDTTKLISQLDVDVVRIVYSRSNAKAILEFLESHHKEASSVPVMLDISTWTQGYISSSCEAGDVKYGEQIEFGLSGTDARFIVSSKIWDQLFVEGEKAFLGFGNIVLKTLKIGKDKVSFEVLQGGQIHPGMDIYVPSSRNHPELGSISEQDLKAFADTKIDYLVIPGQWSSNEINAFRDKLIGFSGEDAAPWLLAKVDGIDVYERLSDVVHAVSGIVISRREIALTTSPASVPMITKQMIQFCEEYAKLVVVASELLASMRHNITPTRAEVSDIANAVLDGTDATVLSEEVAFGSHGTEAVKVMNRVINDAEVRSDDSDLNWEKIDPPIHNEMDAISYNAYKTAQRIGAKAVVCITKSGNTALKLASYKLPLPIIAVTFSKNTKDKLNLVRGVSPLHLDMEPNLDGVLPTVNDYLLKNSWLQEEDRVVFVSVTLSPLSKESSNLFTIQTLR